MMKKRLKTILAAALATVAMTVLAVVFAGRSDKDEHAELVDNRTVVMSATETDVTLGGTMKLKASLSLGKGKFAWSSSDETIVSVKQDGTLNALALGTAKITASCGDKAGSCTVTVVLPDGYPVFAEYGQTAELFIGKNWNIHSDVLYNGSPVPAAVTYDSKDPSVATVSSSGVITGVGEGDTEIVVQADYEGMAASMTVGVTVYGDVIVETESTSVALQLLNDDANGFSTTNVVGIRGLSDLQDVTDSIEEVKWTAKDISIAAVSEISDANGEKRASVTAVSNGSTEIVCSFVYNGTPYSKTFVADVEKAKYRVDGTVAYDSVLDGNKVIAIPAELPGPCELTSAFSVKFGETPIGFIEYAGGTDVICAGAANLAKGETDIVFTDEKWECVYGASLYCTGVLTQDSHEVLDAGGMIAAGESYALLEDIDLGWTGDKEPVQIMGTLEGMGHTIKGITIGVKPTSGWTVDPNDGSQTFSSYIALNSGVIKNVRFEFEIAVMKNDDKPTFLSLVEFNRGEISNTVVMATVRDNGWWSAVYVAKNYGMIRNSVTVIPYIENSSRSRLSAFVCFSYGGTIQNCYTCGSEWDGMNDADAYGAGKCYSEAYDGGVTVSNWKGVSDPSAIADTENFAPSDGWNGYWNKNENTITFGGEEVNITPTEYFSASYAEESSGNIILPLPEGLLPGTKKPTVTFGDKEVKIVSLSGNTLIAEKGNLAYGTYNVKIAYDDMTYVAKNVRYVTKALKNSDMENFKSILQANPDGYFLLTEDIDFKGTHLVGNINFGGTFDGGGYALKNFILDYLDAENGYNTWFINTNTGIIKDVKLVIAGAKQNNNQMSFININKGTIENIYVDFTFNETQPIYAWSKYAALVYDNNGTVRNCIFEIRVPDGVDIGVGQGENADKTIFAAVAAYNKGGGCIENCHIVTGGKTIDAILWPWGTQTNNASYDTMQELAASVIFNSENGWSKYWKTENGEVVFGN